MRKLVYAGLILSFSCLLIAAGCQVTQPTPQTTPLSSVVSNAESATYASLFGNSLMYVNNKMINIAKSPAAVSSALGKGIKAADGAPLQWVKYTSHEVTIGYAYDTYIWYVKELDQWGNTKLLLAYGSVSVYPKSGSSSASITGNKITAKATNSRTTSSTSTRTTTSSTTRTTTSTWNFNPNVASIVLHFGDPVCFAENGTPLDPTDPRIISLTDLTNPNFDKTKFFFYEGIWSGTLSIDKISLSTTAIMTFKIGTDKYIVSSTNAQIVDLLSDHPTANWPITILKNGASWADGTISYETDGNWYLKILGERIWLPIVPVVKWIIGSSSSTTSTMGGGGPYGYISGTISEGTQPWFVGTLIVAAYDINNYNLNDPGQTNWSNPVSYALRPLPPGATNVSYEIDFTSDQINGLPDADGTVYVAAWLAPGDLTSLVTPVPGDLFGVFGGNWGGQPPYPGQAFALHYGTQQGFQDFILNITW